MSAHSLLAHRSGTADTFRFDSERCSQYVPLRLPSTLCLQERLPPGAAAVLLNRSHPFHDLILVLDAHDQRLFEAIDGRRTVKQIVEHADTPWPCARTLFEKLWRHDQVVFDASRAG